MVSTRNAGTPSHVSCRPQAFSTSRRFDPPFGFAGLLHPAATPRVPSVQGLLPIQSRPGSSPVRASLPLPSRRSPASRLPRPPASTSRPCSLDRCVPQRRCLDFLAAAPLFGFPLPQAPRSHGRPVSPALRSGRFPVAVFLRTRKRAGSPRRRVSSVSSVEPPTLPSPEAPACPRSRAFR